MKKIMLALLGFFAVSSTSAENWVEAGMATDNTLKYFVDIDSIKPVSKRIITSPNESKNFIEAVVQPTYLKGNENRKKGIFYTKSLWYISCENSSVYTQATVNYGKNGDVISSWQNTNTIFSDSFDYMFDGTLGGSVLKTVCTTPQSKKRLLTDTEKFYISASCMSEPNYEKCYEDKIQEQK